MKLIQTVTGTGMSWSIATSLVFAVATAMAGEAGPVPDPDALVFDTPDAIELARLESAERPEVPASSDDREEREVQAQGADDLVQFRDAVRAREAEGAWTAGLSEDLIGLGRALQARGEHAQAIPVFERAGHVARVNRGLHTMDQLPALKERIDSHVALGQWEEADQQQQYSFYLHSRAMDSDEPELVEALQDFAHWNLSVHFRGIEETPVRLVDAYQLIDAAHELVVQNHGDDLQRQLALLDTLAGVAWLVARTQIGDDPQMLQGDRGFNQRAVVSFNGRQTRSAYRINGFAQGEAALQRAVDLQAQRFEQGEADLLDVAEALARLGDWYLLFDRRQASRDAYERAWTLVSEQAPGKLEEAFGAVQVLPRFTSFSDQRRYAADGGLRGAMQRGHVDVKLRVSRYGRADDVEVIGGDPVTIEEVESRLSRNLRSMRLRPRLQEGELVDTEDVVLRLPYWY